MNHPPFAASATGVDEVREYRDQPPRRVIPAVAVIGRVAGCATSQHACALYDDGGMSGSATCATARRHASQASQWYIRRVAEPVLRGTPGLVCCTAQGAFTDGVTVAQTTNNHLSYFTNKKQYLSHAVPKRSVCLADVRKLMLVPAHG